MKTNKRITLIIVAVLIFSFVFPYSVFAHDDRKEIAENDKIYTFVPWEYELSVFSDSLSYYDEDGNYLEFCVGENKFAPEGICILKDWQVQKVFEHFYLYESDLERTDECFVKYELTEKRETNGYSCYYVQGNYAYSEEDVNGEFAYYFNSYIFATKENIFVVSYEDINGNTEYYGDLMTAVYGIVLNGTHFENDKPEKNADHDFSNSPAYEEVIIASQENFMGDVFEDDSMVSMVAGFIALFTIAPTLILIIVAVTLIVKYSKNKKKLKQYELTYGSIPQYKAYPQNYGGYGYNQPVNQQYQPPVYQQNPVNQNAPQTPSYVANAVNNLDAQQVNQPTQPAQTNLPPEMQEFQNSNENKF